MPLIDLDALTAKDRLPKVKLFGREMTVYPMTGAAAHKIAVVQDQDSTGGSLLGPLLEVLASCVPELATEERERLTVDQIAALLQLSRGQVAEVEAMLSEQVASVPTDGAVGNG